MGFDDTIQQKAHKVAEQHQMPPERAHVKAEGAEVGKLVAFGGVLVCLASAAGGLIAAVKNASVLVVLALSLPPALLGLSLIFFGGSLISRDAEPIIAKIGAWLVSMVRAGRSHK